MAWTFFSKHHLGRSNHSWCVSFAAVLPETWLSRFGGGGCSPNSPPQALPGKAKVTAESSSHARQPRVPSMVPGETLQLHQVWGTCQVCISRFLMGAPAQMSLKTKVLGIPPPCQKSRQELIRDRNRKHLLHECGLRAGKVWPFAQGGTLGRAPLVKGQA